MYSKILVLFLIILTSCAEKKEYEHYFDKLDYSNTVLSKECLKHIYIEKENGTYVIINKGKPFKYQLSDTIYEKIDALLGLYRDYGKGFVLTYRFDTVGTTQTLDITNAPYYKNILFNEKKDYIIKDKKFTIFEYSEYFGSAGIMSYYLKDFGFIAYDFENNNYLICRRASKYNNVSEDELNAVCDSLVRDSCFFSIYFLMKSNPCNGFNKLYADSVVKKSVPPAIHNLP